MAHEFRESLLDKSKDPVISGDIEIDEIYQSAGNKGLKKTIHEKKGLKKRGRDTYKKDKPPIITIVEIETRNTILVVEKNLSKDLIREKIETHCKGRIRAFTDD